MLYRCCFSLDSTHSLTRSPSHRLPPNPFHSYYLSFAASPVPLSFATSSSRPPVFWRQLVDRLHGMRMGRYHAAARRVQAAWRGHLSRRTVLDFYARREYLAAQAAHAAALGAEQAAQYAVTAAAAAAMEAARLEVGLHAAPPHTRAGSPLTPWPETAHVGSAFARVGQSTLHAQHSGEARSVPWAERGYGNPQPCRQCSERGIYVTPVSDLAHLSLQD